MEFVGSLDIGHQLPQIEQMKHRLFPIKAPALKLTQLLGLGARTPNRHAVAETKILNNN